MSMILKNYTISHRLKINHSSNGVETGSTVYSEPGIRAELMLFSNEQWRKMDRPGHVHVSINADIDQPPNLSATEFRAWLRDLLIEMLGDGEDKVPPKDGGSSGHS